MSQISDHLEDLYECGNRLRTLLQPYDIQLTAIGAKPLAQCGLSDLARMAQAVERIFDAGVESTKEQPIDGGCEP